MLVIQIKTIQEMLILMLGGSDVFLMVVNQLKELFFLESKQHLQGLMAGPAGRTTLSRLLTFNSVQCGTTGKFYYLRDLDGEVDAHVEIEDLIITNQAHAWSRDLLNKSFALWNGISYDLANCVWMDRQVVKAEKALKKSQLRNVLNRVWMKMLPKVHLTKTEIEVRQRIMREQEHLPVLTLIMSWFLDNSGKLMYPPKDSPPPPEGFRRSLQVPLRRNNLQNNSLMYHYMSSPKSRYKASLAFHENGERDYASLSFHHPGTSMWSCTYWDDTDAPMLVGPWDDFHDFPTML